MAASVLARAAPMVLVVDDEPDIRETIAEALMLEGYVQVEGAAVLLRKPFDLTTLLTTISRLCDGDREISTKSNSTS